METQNNYKRTVAGSVGAGMGAIFNGSGRTYYILEHKTSSKYHSAGESQKIIIDQIEIGRDASCQVRYDESFDTVSRKHAAIIRDGNNWQLVHLSNSNPTLVNGRPIQGSYYLQSGDEIQLSVNGPRLGFIQPQGKQGLTSSIKLTERMNLFRQQALRPYRRAIWALTALLILVILGFGAWNYKLTLDNKALRQEMALYQAQVDSLGLEKMKLDNMEQQLSAKLANDPNNQEIKQQLGQVQKERVRVVYAYNNASQRLASTKAKLADYGFDDDEDTGGKGSEATPAVAAATGGQAGLGTTGPITDGEERWDNSEQAVVSAEGVAVNPGNKNDFIDKSNPTIQESAQNSAGASDNIVNYYNDIYTLKVKRITLERDGNSYDPGIATSQLVVGTGFVIGGKFITARSNLQPWVYRNVYRNDDWRQLLAEYVAAGFHVILDFEAYSTRGSGHPLRFSNTQFDLASLEAYDGKDVVRIRKDVLKKARQWGVDIEYKRSTYQNFVVTYYTDNSHNAASLALGAPGGLPVDIPTAQSLKGSEEVVIAGFSGRTDIQVLSNYVKYFTSRTSRLAARFITLQDASTNWGFTGSPAFFKESNGSYRVVGVNVGNFGGEVRIVPIHRVR
ncbi:MAG: FHA domain-containing protein [Prevotella sp.]|nr:FHA domain-containing protein [Prevotella sp.]